MTYQLENQHGNPSGVYVFNAYHNHYAYQYASNQEKYDLVLRRLAAYEDTGLSPEEVASLRSALARAERERDAALADIAEVEHVFGGTWRGRRGAEQNGAIVHDAREVTHEPV
jgi:hypothetical protein